MASIPCHRCRIPHAPLKTHRGFATSGHRTAEFVHGGQEAAGQAQPHIPLLHLRPFCFLSKLTASASLLSAPWQGHLKICPVAQRCIQPCSGVTMAPQERGEDSRRPLILLPTPTPKQPLCSAGRGMALVAEPQTSGLVYSASPWSWSPAGRLAPLQRSPTLAGRSRPLGFHASAAAATTRLN